MGEREGLIARIRQVRRASARAGAGAEPPRADERARSATSAPRQDQLRELEARIAHLEHLLQGLQDSVHRESTRVSQRIAELEAQIQPTALAKVLSEDARERGL